MSRGQRMPNELDFEDDADFEFGEDMDIPHELDEYDAAESSNSIVGRIRGGVNAFLGTFWGGALIVGRIMKPFVYYGLVPFILGLGVATTKTSVLAVIFPFHELQDANEAQTAAMQGGYPMGAGAPPAQ